MVTILEISILSLIGVCLNDLTATLDFLSPQDGGRSPPTGLLCQQPAKAPSVGQLRLQHFHFTVLHAALRAVSVLLNLYLQLVVSVCKCISVCVRDGNGSCMRALPDVL